MRCTYFHRQRGTINGKDISHDILGTGEMAEGELFLQMAERRTAAYMAALMGIGVDAESLEEDYDAHMADLRDTAYPFP